MTKTVMTQKNARTYRLVIACPDRVGIVARVSGFLADHGGWITESNHHADPVSGWFFMRNEIMADSLPFDNGGFYREFTPIAEEFAMEWHIADSARPKRLVLMASKESHCLADLLHRWHSGEMECEIAAIISNHENLRKMVEWHEIPFHHVPVDKDNKAKSFSEVENLIEQANADAIILARYMQILPESICQKYPARIINIHHSFLPSFAGAKPYHQAYQRGVKLIGATCHYVTAELDEGPIIDQDVIRVSHVDSIADMKRLGKDVEQTVLARGVRYHLEDRVIVHENKTVVLR